MAKTPIKKENKFGSSINIATGITKVEKPNQVPAKEEMVDPPESKRDPHKGGRPSNGPVFRHSLSIPQELMEGVDAAAMLYKNNRTAYIVSLIRKDLKENGKKYEELVKLVSKC